MTPEPAPPDFVEPRQASRFVCGEVRGGNDPIHERIELPGMRGMLYSHPCRGASGGDIHYMSVCGSGLIARVFLADVAGHGETIAAVGAEMHALLRRSVDTIDDRRVLARLDAQLQRAGLDTMATAAVATYYPPARRLTVGYAGHPPGWLYRASEQRWSRLDGPSTAPRSHRFLDLPLGTGLSPGFTRRRFELFVGDRILLVTDGVLEATSDEGHEFGEAGLEGLLRDGSADLDTLDRRLLAALRAHAGSHHLAHDDVTFFLGEIVPGPRGPALWHVVWNQLLMPLIGPAEISPPTE
jgi:phosphoserine phosphatase RsbU/P